MSTAKKQDITSPYVADVRELGRQAGSYREYTFQAPQPAPIELGIVKVPNDQELDVYFRLEAVTEGVLVTGEVKTQAVGECSRCLDPMKFNVDASFQELFAYPGSTTEQTSDDDIYVIDGDYVDLGSLVVEAVVLTLPTNPVCSEDCAGLCPGCGQKQDELPNDHSHEQADPRWSALANWS